jgi:hypothetical protein
MSIPSTPRISRSKHAQGSEVLRLQGIVGCETFKKSLAFSSIRLYLHDHLGAREKQGVVCFVMSTSPAEGRQFLCALTDEALSITVLAAT